jgi:hypothetical protein
MKRIKPRRKVKESGFYWARLPVLGDLGSKAVLSKEHAAKVERLDCVLDFVPESRIFKFAVVTGDLRFEI